MLDKTLKNSFVVKFSGKAEIPTNLEIGFNYLISAQGTVTSLTESDNDDGTHTIYYKFEPVHVDMISDKGEKIKIKDVAGKVLSINAITRKVLVETEDGRQLEVKWPCHEDKKHEK